jgi:hypothetical protein
MLRPARGGPRAARSRTPRAPSPAFPVRCRAQHAEDVLLYDLFEGGARRLLHRGGGLRRVLPRRDLPLRVHRLDRPAHRGPPRASRAGPARCRPASTVVHAALGKRGSSGTTTLTRFVDPGGTDELSSYIADIGGDAPRPSADGAESIEVPLTTMDRAARRDGPHGRRSTSPSSMSKAERSTCSTGSTSSASPPARSSSRTTSAGDDSPNARALDRPRLHPRGWISFNRLMIHESDPDLLLRARALLYTTDSGTMPPEPVPHNT